MSKAYPHTGMDRRDRTQRRQPRPQPRRHGTKAGVILSAAKEW